jgi:YVTN family beta-propeller protein
VAPIGAAPKVSSLSGGPARPRAFRFTLPLFAPDSPWNQTATNAAVLPESDGQILVTYRDGPCQSRGGGLVGTEILEAGVVDFFDVRGPGVSSDTYYSARATGTPLLAGLILPEDVESGAISHALAFAIPGLRNTSSDPNEPLASDYFYPASATETGFYNTNPHALAAGQRVRLKQTIVNAEGNPLDENRLAPITRMFLTALRTYGAYAVDNAGGFTFYAEDIHTAVLHLTDDQVNTLIGQPAGTPLSADKTRWQLVIEKLNLELAQIPIAYGSWSEGQDPATATITTSNFEVIEPATQPICCDLSSDRTVKFADIQAVAGNWNTTSAGSDWNSDYDLGRDRDIDVVDVTLAAPAPVKRSSSAITITSDGAMLLVVNPDSNTLTLVDTAGQEKVAEIQVGVDPRTVAVDDGGRRAYVANRGSGSVSVVNLATRAAIAEIPVGYRPYGVVVNPAGDRLYVAVQGLDRIAVIDTATLAVVDTLPVPDRPSGLAISEDGRALYVTHLLTGEVSVVALDRHLAYLPLLLKMPAGPLSASHTKGQLRCNTQYAIRNTQYTTPIPNIQYPISTIPLWPDSNLVQSILLSPDGRTAYVPHTRSNTTNLALTFDTTVFPLVSLIDLTTQQHLVGQQIALGTLDPPGVGLPFDAAVTPDGEELWVVNAASNDVSVVDLAGRRLAAHIEVGDNPRGIVLAPDGTTAYVNNTLAGTVSVIDTAAYTVTATIDVTRIPLPPILLNGKRLFHSSDDPRMSRAQWISCNTCHFEGEQDGRTWNFGFAGPRNTTSLLGMIQTYPLRWSGEWDESADSEFVIRKENFGSGLIDGDVNCSLSPVDCVHQPPNQGRSYDLDCLATFIDSLQVPLSPAHAHGEPLTQAEQRGKAIFEDPDLGCIDCHPPPFYTDREKHNVGTGTPDERIGPAFDTPTLRGLYDSAPYFHDGSAGTLYEVLTRPSPESEHDVRGVLTDAKIQDLIAFLEALPYE